MFHNSVLFLAIFSESVYNSKLTLNRAEGEGLR